ncbi:MAG: NAD(P)-binding domain-containing protein [Microthrixaceae bacterium]
MPESNDLIVIGGNAGGLSAAVFARESGLERVTVLEEGSTLALPGVAGEYGLEVSYGETVTSVDLDGEDLVVTTKRQTLRGRAVLVALRDAVDGWTPPVPTQTSDRVHLDEIPTPANDVDVLVVGYTDHAVELTVQLADLGAGVVLAAGGMNPRRLSPVGARLLSDLERERRSDAALLVQAPPGRRRRRLPDGVLQRSPHTRPPVRPRRVLLRSPHCRPLPRRGDRGSAGHRQDLVPGQRLRDPGGGSQRHGCLDRP